MREVLRLLYAARVSGTRERRRIAGVGMFLSPFVATAACRSEARRVSSDKFTVGPTDLGFSGAVPPRAEAETRKVYDERGAEAPGHRTAPRPLLTRVRPPLL